jgi:hypothetical protein
MNSRNRYITPIAAGIGLAAGGIVGSMAALYYWISTPQDVYKIIIIVSAFAASGAAAGATTGVIIERRRSRNQARYTLEDTVTIDGITIQLEESVDANARDENNILIATIKSLAFEPLLTPQEITAYKALFKKNAAEEFAYYTDYINKDSCGISGIPLRMLKTPITIISTTADKDGNFKSGTHTYGINALINHINTCSNKNTFAKEPITKVLLKDIASARFEGGFGDRINSFITTVRQALQAEKDAIPSLKDTQNIRLSFTAPATPSAHSSPISNLLTPTPVLA